MIREQIAKDFARAVKKFPKGTVVHAKYRIGEDWEGDPAIFFNIVLSDEASRDDRLSGVTRRIQEFLEGEMNTYDNWGIFPHTSFRSETEYKTIKDPEWTFGVS